MDVFFSLRILLHRHLSDHRSTKRNSHNHRLPPSRHLLCQEKAASCDEYIMVLQVLLGAIKTYRSFPQLPTQLRHFQVSPLACASISGYSQTFCTHGAVRSENAVPEKTSKEGGETGSSHTSGPSGKPIRGSPVSWMSLLLLMLTGSGLIVYFDREQQRRIEEMKTALTKPRSGPSVGTAAIGGPFELVNHEGKRVTQDDFLGKWTIMYFGFTHCPDICPDELQKLCAAIDKIKDKTGINIVPVFISVDPERDTVEQIGEYVKEFHPNLIGLTGTSEDVRRTARAYRVYYMKTEQEGSDYLVDHSIVMYLMNPEMQFVKFFGKNYNENSLAEGIMQEIKHHKN